ncbi:hypothetical protein OSB04_021831 [Centaurea solstitialis]|uniref:Uncharacterized protein n=1 Tax=Centaurea solstitialis TaxID=347529 RepID=A0AA38T2N9_9ASTR|nr:hypothetical protein OSB04_021831 [Centaurea solstitialis]
MSLIKDRTAANPPSTSSRSRWSLGCFGCAGDTMQPSTEEEVNSSSGRRRKWVFKWKSSFKKSAAKTVVPVELPGAPGPRKTKSFPRATPNTTTWEIQVVEEDQGRIYLEPSRRKKWIDIVKRQNGSSNRSRHRKETKPATAVAPPAPELRSPEKNSATISGDVVPIVIPVTKPLTRSKSISPPPAKGKKLPRDSPAGGGVDDGGLNKTTSFGGGGFDSIIGMSIILVTLVIMMLWGKLCAILCTSAWFFIAPRLVATGENSAVATAEKRVAELESFNNKVDLESVEYKKKVVLEGLLQRNHRNVVVGRL